MAVTTHARPRVEKHAPHPFLFDEVTYTRDELWKARGGWPVRTAPATRSRRRPTR